MSKGRQHQRGYIFLKSGSWYLRYRQYEPQADGSSKLVQRCRKLADNQGPYRSKKAVRVLAGEFLAPLNNGTTTIASCMSVAEFWDKEYLPHVTESLKPSTVCGYKQDWKKHLNNRLLMPLRDFHTVDCQRVLQEIAQERAYASSTLHDLKCLMSGIIRYAIRTGRINGTNPVREACIPRGNPRQETYAYNLQQIREIMEVMPLRERALIAVLGFLGLRRGEARCLDLRNYDGAFLRIESSAWRSCVTSPKGKVGTGTLPVIPTVARVLAEYLAIAKPKKYIFENVKGGPANIAYWINTVIRPKLAEAGIPWYGLHAFRRGLATNLFELEVEDKTIQVLLRHSNVRVTREHYIRNHAVDPRSIAAMEALETALCNQRATAAQIFDVGSAINTSNQTGSQILSDGMAAVRTAALHRTSRLSAVRNQQLSVRIDHGIRAPYRESASNCATDVQPRENHQSEPESPPSKETAARTELGQGLLNESQFPHKPLPFLDCLYDGTTPTGSIENLRPTDACSGHPDFLDKSLLSTKSMTVPASLIARYSREKLYEEVWTYPMRTLAPHYGVSDRALRKTCDRLHIPVPPQGYWNKIAAGKEVLPRPALPQVQVVEKQRNGRGMSSVSPQEQNSIAAQIACDVLNGKTLKSACRKAGISYDSYRPWYRRHLRETTHLDDNEAKDTATPTKVSESASSEGADGNAKSRPSVSEKLLARVNREKLYDEVWRAPMSVVAKQYAVSTQTLRRWCDELHIPIPVAGHWARLAHQWPVQQKPPLPEVQIAETRKKERRSNVYSAEEIALMSERIADAHLSGVSFVMACIEVGIAVTTYRRWRRRFAQSAGAKAAQSRGESQFRNCLSRRHAGIKQ